MKYVGMTIKPCNVCVNNICYMHCMLYVYFNTYE